MIKKYKAIVFLLIICSGSVKAQLLINEIQVTNHSTIQDEDGDFEDWFEIYNAGTTGINLGDYFVSDRPEVTTNWQLPALTLNPQQHLFVFASGKNRYGGDVVIDHLESPVFPWNTWSYLVPSSEPSSFWKNISFDDSGWNTGTGGIGYGDGDDGTDLGGNALSVFCRTSFDLSNPNDVGFMVLNIDYDDAFVCYLNGVEVVRENIGSIGIAPAFDQPADVGHEAVGYSGGNADSYIIDFSVFQELLVVGENVISLQVHNSEVASSDLTGNVYTVLGMTSDEVQTQLSPEWINYDFPRNHSDFGLSAGEILYIKNVSNEILDSKLIGPMQTDNSVCRTTDGSNTWCYSNAPTPGNNNTGLCFESYNPVPQFSISSGVYPVPVYLTITHPDPSAQIYITYDGSIPDQNDELYVAPFAVVASAVVSARAFSNNALPSPDKKNTYLINEFDIALPIVSVSTDPANLWDPVTGLHVFGPEDYDTGVPFFGANFWENWEREAYVEYFDSSHVKKMEGPVGVKIHGGWSRSNEQKSLRIQAKGKFGMESMDYPLLADKPYIESFKGFNLRNGGNAYWDNRFHDALIERTTRNTNVDYMSYAPAIVFLNGEYWGFMEIRENLDQHYIANNHDISASDATVVSANYLGFNVINGSPDSFYELHELATLNDPQNDNYFENIAQLLDVENYADYIIAQTYWANGDWSNGWQNNTKLWHDDRPEGKWRFMLMDMDFGMGLAGASPYDDYINTAGDEGYLTDQLFGALIQNPEFRNYFINRYADLINTEFQIDKVTAMAHEMRDEVEPVFQRHAQRWGTDSNALNGTLEGRLDWAELRVQGGRDVVENHFDLPYQVDITLDIMPAGAGRIHISTIEPNEAEYPWTGVYFNGNPVKISVVENPGFTFTHWLANGVFNTDTQVREHIINFDEDLIFTAVFIGAAVDNAIAVTEMMFHPDTQSGSGDWIEIHNNATVPVNVSHWYIKDSNYFNVFEFPENTFLEANSFVVVASEVVAFQNAYLGVGNVVGPMSFSLGNTSDKVYLFKPDGSEYLSYTYTNDDGINLDCSSGIGHSREHSISSNDYASNTWFLGCENGSPGIANIPCEYQVSLSEINYNSSTDDDSGDWIELHNTTSEAIDIGGWSIRDENDNVYLIPAGTSLESDEYLVVARSSTAFASIYPVTENFIGPSNLAFGNDGDAIKIYDNQNTLRLSMRYKSNAPWPYQPNGLGYTLEYEAIASQPCFMINWSAGCPLGSPARSFEPTCAALVSIDKFQKETGLKIYPNPANDVVYINDSEGELNALRIYDLQSRLIEQIVDSKRGLWQVDVSEFPSGVYLLETNFANGQKEIVKLVID